MKALVYRGQQGAGGSTSTSPARICAQTNLVYRGWGTSWPLLGNDFCLSRRGQLSRGLAAYPLAVLTLTATARSRATILGLDVVALGTLRLVVVDRWVSRADGMPWSYFHFGTPSKGKRFPLHFHRQMWLTKVCPFSGAVGFMWRGATEHAPFWRRGV